MEPEVMRISEHSASHQGVMFVEIALWCTLCWLAGGSQFDVRDIGGIFRVSFVTAATGA